MARSSPASWLLAIPALLFLIAPFAALVFATYWSHFELDRADWSAIAVSLGYGASAMLVVVALGTPLAWWLARTKFAARWIADAIVLLPLLSPPLALGILLATLYGPYGAAGAPLARLGLLLTNSAPAFVLALTYGALPFYVVLARAAFEGVPTDYESLALTLGKSRLAV
ncbi:MAG TPA: ABC transporter permease subunit, partial [Candidatus Dormibacteraeota bacterium]|nr:ABC transporter permease subunit [Candidatus Dormibacteraeota bacterium]